MAIITQGYGASTGRIITQGYGTGVIPPPPPPSAPSGPPAVATGGGGGGGKHRNVFAVPRGGRIEVAVVEVHLAVPIGLRLRAEIRGTSLVTGTGKIAGLKIRGKVLTETSASIQVDVRLGSPSLIAKISTFHPVAIAGGLFVRAPNVRGTITTDLLVRRREEKTLLGLDEEAELLELEEGIF